jgi:RNA polymerase sigma factor (TIGR02999 family)
MSGGRAEITTILRAAAAGDRQAASDLLPLVYDDLKGLAHVRLRGLKRGETITTTDLVHDCWLRLVGQGDPGWESRRHFYGAAARAMRNILVERIRRKSTLKREVSRRVELPEEVAVLDDGGVAQQEDVLAVGEALERFEREHQRPAEVVWPRRPGEGQSTDYTGIVRARATKPNVKSSGFR